MAYLRRFITTSFEEFPLILDYPNPCFQVLRQVRSKGRTTTGACYSNFSSNDEKILVHHNEEITDQQQQKPLLSQH